LDAYIELVASRLNILEVEGGAMGGCGQGSSKKSNLVSPNLRRKR
jgi:hypothetical protein